MLLSSIFRTLEWLRATILTTTVYNLVHVKFREHFLYERQIVFVLDHTQ